MGGYEALQRYLEDLRRVRNEVWSLVDFRGRVVVDVGVGESTEELARLGAEVVGLELEAERVRIAGRLKGYLNHLVRGDASLPPLREGSVDIMVFHFTLHEIDPSKHLWVLRAAQHASGQVLIVEPAPLGESLYNRFAQVWRRAMHSIGRFEDYKPLSYWTGILASSGYRVVRVKTVKWRVKAPPSVLRELVDKTCREWKALGVGERHIDELREVLREAERKGGLLWSDINVILGEKHPGSPVRQAS